MEENTIEVYTSTFEQLQKKMKWYLIDKQMLMIIAAAYTMNHKPFDYKHFISLADLIKKEAGLFSPLKSQSRYTTASMLDVNFEHPEEKVTELFLLYDQLIKAKFKRGSFTYLAATILLTNNKKDKDLHGVITDAKEIYDVMKSDHYFLTSGNDIPLAVFLALQNNDAKEKMELFYEKLHKNGFKKGNDLQFLSHILSIDTDKSIEELVTQTTSIFDEFKLNGIKQKATYYPGMGMVALLPSEKINMKEITKIYEQLNSQKQFKWKKDINILLAISFFVSENIEDSNFTDVGIFTTLETLLQVQQAIMISSTTAASSSASSGGN